jgi:voltage-gated potassium channel
MITAPRGTESGLQAGSFRKGLGAAPLDSGAVSRPWLFRLVLPVAIVATYFLVPVAAYDAPIGLTAGIAVSVAGLATVVVVTVDELRRSERRLELVHLGLILEIALVSFATVYYLMSLSTPAEFTGVHTRIDALYLSMATVSTVGFGDASATGQLARAVITGQMAFNIAFVATLVGLFQSRLQTNRERRREH